MEGLSRELQWKILRDASDEFWEDGHHITEISEFEEDDFFEINVQALIGDGYIDEAGGGRAIKITAAGLDFVGIPPEQRSMQLKVVQHLYEEYKPYSLYSLHKISKELDLDSKKLWATIYYWDNGGLLESCSLLSSWEIHFTPSMELFREYDLPIDVIVSDEIEPEFSDLRFIKGLREIDMGGYGTIYTWFNTELARMEAIKIMLIGSLIIISRVRLW